MFYNFFHAYISLFYDFAQMIHTEARSLQKILLILFQIERSREYDSMIAVNVCKEFILYYVIYVLYDYFALRNFNFHSFLFHFQEISSIVCYSDAFIGHLNAFSDAVV